MTIYQINQLFFAVLSGFIAGALTGFAISWLAHRPTIEMLREHVSLLMTRSKSYDR